MVYPVVGGVSGNSSRNAPRATLNPSSDRWRNVVFGDFHFLTIGEKYDPGKKNDEFIVNNHSISPSESSWKPSRIPLLRRDICSSEPELSSRLDYTGWQMQTIAPAMLTEHANGTKGQR